jgi:hypothetical protein
MFDMGYSGIDSIQGHRLDRLGGVCISRRWRGDDYADGMETGTWNRPKESVTTWLY